MSPDGFKHQALPFAGAAPEHGVAVTTNALDAPCEIMAPARPAQAASA
jgi:hypothetical protein